VARASTHERVAIAVAQQTSSLKRFVIGLAAVVIVGVGVLVWMNQRNAANSRDTIAALLARSDSLSEALQRTTANASGREAGLDSLVRVLQRERAQLARQLQAGGSNVGQITTQLDALDRRTNQALSIGGADYRDIAAANTRAVAFLAVEEQSGDAYSGTAFSITPGGLLVTNRHLLRDTSGNLPRRLGVWFSGDSVFRPARVVRVSDEHDLALIQIIEPGTYSTVRGIVASDGVAAGDLVAVIGFPLGTTLARGSVKLPITASGMVSKAEPNRLSIEAYAAEGSSGSPVFDARGNVIGVLFGSPEETRGRIMYVVPSSALIALLEGSERALVR
jgi:S1-C subfamily serine protease